MPTFSVSSLPDTEKAKLAAARASIEARTPGVEFVKDITVAEETTSRNRNDELQICNGEKFHLESLDVLSQNDCYYNSPFNGKKYPNVVLFTADSTHKVRNLSLTSIGQSFVKFDKATGLAVTNPETGLSERVGFNLASPAWALWKQTDPVTKKSVVSKGWAALVAEQDRMEYCKSTDEGAVEFPEELVDDPANPGQMISAWKKPAHPKGLTVFHVASVVTQTFDRSSIYTRGVITDITFE